MHTKANWARNTFPKKGRDSMDATIDESVNVLAEGTLEKFTTNRGYTSIRTPVSGSRGVGYYADVELYVRRFIGDPNNPIGRDEKTILLLQFHRTG